MRTINNQPTVKLLSSLLLVSLFMSLNLNAQPIHDQLPMDEPELVVEEWMTNTESFNTDESILEIEDWMTDLESFSNEDLELIHVEAWMTDISSFNVDEETSLEVESWMTSLENYYNIDSYLLAEVDEQPLFVENWMTDYNAFQKTSAFEIEGIKEIELDTNIPVLMALRD